MIAFLLSLTAAVLLVGCDAPEEEASGSNGREQETVIAVISRGFQHQFWQTVKRGSLEAAEELGVALTFDGPATEEMVDVQIDLMENAIRRNAEAILLAALDSGALVPYVERARADGIPVGTFDSGVDTEVVFHVGTDNYAAGARAAQELAELIGGAGIVAMVLHDEGSETGAQREAGFVETMEASYPDIELVPPVYSGGDHQRSGMLIRGIMNEHPGLTAVFAGNEGATIGVARALAGYERGPQIPVVGFDAAPEQLELLREGVIAGLVVQDPYAMGYRGVSALVGHLRGEEVEERIVTEAVYVTRELLEEPEIRELLRLEDLE